MPRLITEADAVTDPEPADGVRLALEADVDEDTAEEDTEAALHERSSKGVVLKLDLISLKLGEGKIGSES